MKQLLRVCVSGFFVLFMTVGHAEEGMLMVTNAWVREAPPGSTVLAAYMTVQNRTEGFRVLEKISSSDFEKVEIHKMETSDGVVRMVPAAIMEIAPGKDLTLQPGGLHIMLRNPKKPLRAGDKVTFKLYFKDLEPKEIKLPVKRVTGKTGKNDKMDHNHMDQQHH